ncbi:hypothetical protein Drose_35910 [Dactylosporangium roseum]|uniref:MalT-like TPR region domain-containing protein n=1 Tax=Dactylosporangium roseum TaxID=47989 RepID=A0ABY5Z6K9_9ACTN|nr:hypothetical protein [Dactylosporangium roseum]UWZ36363.1 hypothetical protein Drose_35910 [Dactylosporangium roseum]
MNAFSVLEKLATAVADPADRQLLVERLNDGDSDLLMRLNDVLGQLGSGRVWLVIDDAQDLFTASSGKWRDEALGLVLDELGSRPGHRVKVLLATEVPLPVPRKATESVTEGLPLPNFPDFLGDLAIPGAPAPRVGALAKATHRHPRTAELVLGIQAINARSAAEPLDVASDATALTKTLLLSLDESQERALRLLAVLDRPVRPAVIAHLDRSSAHQVRAVLDRLVLCRLIRRHDDHYYLPGGEAGRIAGNIPAAEIAAQRGRAAEYLENAALKREAVRLDDLEDAFHAVDLFVDANVPGRAVRLMAALEDRYLRGWGQTAALTPWLTRIAGGLPGFREQVLYVMLAGRALAQQGKLAKAIEVIDGGVMMSARPEERTTHLAFLVQLAAYYFRAGQVEKAAEQYQTLLDHSPAGHKGVSTAHLGLALCLAEAGAFTAADQHLDAAESDVQSADPNVALPLLYLRALINFERGEDGLTVVQLKQTRERAEKLNKRVVTARCDDLAAWVWLLRRDLRRAEART